MTTIPIIHKGEVCGYLAVPASLSGLDAPALHRLTADQIAPDAPFDLRRRDLIIMQVTGRELHSKEHFEKPVVFAAPVLKKRQIKLLPGFISHTEWVSR